MIIAVAYKWAGDSQEATVQPDGRVDFSRATPVVSEYDAVAITVGRRLADALSVELVGICVGGPAAAAPKATKSALSRGLDKVLVVSDEAFTNAGAARTAAALAAAVRRLGDVSLVLTGDSSIDSGTKLVSAVLGGYLAWPTLTDVHEVSVESGAATLERKLASGLQRLRVELPAVLALSVDAAEVKAPGMKDVMAAGKKPVEVVTAPELDVDVLPEGEIMAQAPSEHAARRGLRIAASDPAQAARDLLTALSGLGVLEISRKERS